MERKFRHAKLRVTLGKGGLEFLLEERYLLQSPPRIRLFQFRVISMGARVTELWTLPKATKLTYFRPLLSYSREWKAQELWLARITKGEGKKYGIGRLSVSERHVAFISRHLAYLNLKKEKK